MNPALALSHASRNSVGSTYYPQSALEGFGKALARRLNVNVQYTTGQPRTDGSTIYLPQITGALNEDQFAALCGVAVHEAAHVYFGSVPHHVHYAGGDPLRAACYNAVLDVADETRIEHVLPSAPRLLATSNLDAANRIAASGALLNGDPVWAILSAGILFNRIGRGPIYRPARHSPNWALMLKAYNILKRAKTRRPGRNRGFRHFRTLTQWRALEAIADLLVNLLKHLPAPQPQPTFGPAGMGTSKAGIDAPAPDGAAQAGEAEGAALCDNAAPQSPAGRGNGNHFMRPYDEALYRAMKPALACAIDQLARWDEADGPQGGYASGPRIGRSIERALTDGRCFDRRNAEGEDLSAAILLDCSGSMSGVLARVAAVAQAFAEALATSARSMSLSVFGDSSQPVEDFRAVPNMGGTNAPEALEWALERLRGSEGRRICIIITDGESSGDTEGACRNLTAAGVEIIAIAYDYDAGPILESMPGARVIGANEPTTLACQLTRIAQEIAR